LITPCEATFCLTKNTDANNLKIQKNPISDVPMYVWVSVDNAPVFKCFQFSDTPLKRLQMRKRYFVIQNNYGVVYKGQKWSLLTRSFSPIIDRKDIVGWVSHQFLLTSPTPLKDNNTGLLQKVLVKEGDTSGGEVLKIYNDHAGKVKSDFINARTVFYIYDFYPKSAKNLNSAELLLLGVEPQLDTSASIANITGWIYREHTTFWNSRIACEFPIGTNVELKDQNGTTVFKSSNVKDRLDYNELRYPILKDDEENYHIGIFSRVPSKQLMLRRKIEKIQTGLEVLFIMDGSRSMTKAFRATIKAVKNISTQISEQCKKNYLEQPRFGLMFYRDQQTREPVKKDGEATVPVFIDYCKQETIFYPLGNINRFLKTLDSQIACDSDHSFRESMYLGLIQGIQKCNFHRGQDNLPKRLRVVIHLGDEGDNGRGDFTYHDVLNTLERYHIFSYIAVDVAPNKKQSRFYESVKTIVKQRKNSLYLKSYKDLQYKILAQLFEIHQNTVDLNYQINIIAKGFAGQSPGMAGIVSKDILDYAKKVIRANNINLKEYDYFQQYIEGIYPKKKPLSISILASMTDVENITKSLSDLLLAKDMLKKRKELWEQSLKILIGDQSCEENGQEISLEDCNKKRNGIPIKAGFMKYTKSQFLNLSGQQLTEVFCEVKIALEQFRALIQNKYIKKIDIQSYNPCTYNLKYDWDINGDGKVVHENTSKLNQQIDKYFFREGGESMAWIPLRHFETH